MMNGFNNGTVNGYHNSMMSGYNNGAQLNEDWLISPSMDLSPYDAVNFSYVTAMNYTGPDLEVLISTNYDGMGDPNTA